MQICDLTGSLELWLKQKNIKISIPIQFWALNEAEWHIHASLNYVIIGWSNGSLPVQCQVITWTNAHFLSIEPLGTNFNEI